jgi:flagellar basal-body rod protein FlgC
MFGTLDTTTSALSAYRTQLDVIAGNIAMKDVTRDAEGNLAPYRRRVALLASGNPTQGPNSPGVHVAAIAEDPAPFGLRFEPGHVDAIQDGELKGYVQVSNVDIHTEMVNAISASRAYEANITVAEMAKRMASNALMLLA